MVMMLLYKNPCLSKDGTESPTEISIREVDWAQAARSYSTASSISSGSSP